MYSLTEDLYVVVKHLTKNTVVIDYELYVSFT